MEGRSDRDPMHAPSWPTTLNQRAHNNTSPVWARRVATCGWPERAKKGHDWHILSVPRIGMARLRSAALQAICGYVLVTQLPSFLRNPTAPFIFCPFDPSWTSPPWREARRRNQKSARWCPGAARNGTTGSAGAQKRGTPGSARVSTTWRGHCLRPSTATPPNRHLPSR